MRKKWWKAALIAVALVLIGLLVECGEPSSPVQRENTCMGVELISAEEAAQYGRSWRDVSHKLVYNGVRAPVDRESGTLYLSLRLAEDASASGLSGELYLDSWRGKLYFLREEAFEDLPGAIARGHIFTLLVTDGARRCTRYNVVFTTLPVLTMESDGEVGEDTRGSFCLWNPEDEHGTISERVQWHVRGWTGQTVEKKPWKLSLKTYSGGNKNVNLLGLGSDDDWILNAMGMDDTKVREYLTMAVWNEMASEYVWDRQMSTGEYVEVLVDGDYRGLYLLQRRVDGKYLDLDNELLFKGQSTAVTDTPMDVYTVVYSPLNMASSYEAMNSVWRECSNLDLDNYTDLSVYLQFGCLADNTWYKNMFYLLLPSEQGYSRFLIPWDTDMGFGTSWRDGEGFVYTPDEMLTRNVVRMEYDDMLALYPSLDERMAERWFELRENVLSWENIRALLNEAQSKLCNSGAYDRDAAVWGVRYGGQDTHEALEQWIQERLQWCDEYYSN